MRIWLSWRLVLVRAINRDLPAGLARFPGGLHIEAPGEFANEIANEPRGTARYQGLQADTVSAELANWSARLATRRHTPA
jgi:hypothetical protein